MAGIYGWCVGRWRPALHPQASSVGLSAEYTESVREKLVGGTTQIIVRPLELSSNNRLEVAKPGLAHNLSNLMATIPALQQTVSEIGELADSL